MKKRFQKGFALRAGVWTWAGLSALGLTWQTGCIRENTENCEYRTLLYIVVDRQGVDQVDPGGASVFLFNADRTYVRRIEMSAESIASGRPITLDYRRDNPLWVSVWGNLGGGEEVSEPVPDDRMEELYVSMRRDAEDYVVGADPLYFGIRQLSGLPEERVVITPKTGRIAVTVRGLPEDGDAQRYFLTARTSYDHYDLAGNPLEEERVLRFSGVFRGGDLVTARPFHLVHFPSSPPDDLHMTVNLYDDGGRANSPLLIATADTDNEGRPIVIRQGKTTNVLISIRPTGEIEILVRVTDWDTVTQWEEW